MSKAESQGDAPSLDDWTYFEPLEAAELLTDLEQTCPVDLLTALCCEGMILPLMGLY